MTKNFSIIAISNSLTPIWKIHLQFPPVVKLTRSDQFHDGGSEATLIDLYKKRKNKSLLASLYREKSAIQMTHGKIQIRDHEIGSGPGP